MTLKKTSANFLLVNSHYCFADRFLYAVLCTAGDDLIGPRDIKRGVHLLTNADMAILKEDDEEEEAADQQHSRPRRKRRDSAAIRGEKLTEEQITQAR